MNLPDPSLESAIFNERFFRRYARTIIIAACVVIAAHLVFVDLLPDFSSTFRLQFDLDGSAYFVQWFRDFVIYGTTGVIAWLVAWLFHTLPGASERNSALPWFLIGCVFIYVSMYNNSVVHSLLVDEINGLIEKAKLPGSTTWSVIGLRLPGVLAILVMLRFFQNSLWQNRRARQFVLIAVMLYVLNTVGEIGQAAAMKSLPDNTAAAQAWLVVGASAGLFAGLLWTMGFLAYGIDVLRRTDKTISQDC